MVVCRPSAHAFALASRARAFIISPAGKAAIILTMPDGLPTDGEPKPLMIEVVRSLTATDLSTLRAKSSGQSLAPLTGHMRIRTAHHQIAQFMAQGHELTVIGLWTGYNPSYLCRLAGDPSFAELLSYYQTQQEMIFADVTLRMKTLGLSFLDALQEMLADPKVEWTKRELMEATELLLIKGRGLGSASGAQSGPGITINVDFVKAAGERMTDAKVGVTIEGEAARG